MHLEFIIALIQHRYLGYVFAPYLMYKNGPFYTIHSLLRKQNLTEQGYDFNGNEIELVETIEKYSDEKLVKKFSREQNVSDFFRKLKPETFQKQVSPFIEKQLFRCVQLLMNGSTRLFQKEAKYANLYDEDEVVVNKSFAEAEFHFERNEVGTKYSLKIIQDGGYFTVQNKNITIINSNPAILLYQYKLIAFENLIAKKLTPFFEKEFVNIPASLEGKYYNSFILNTIRDNKVEAIGFDIYEGQPDKHAYLSLEPNLQLNPVLILKFSYGGEKFLADSIKEMAVILEKNGNNYAFRKIKRDRGWEQYIIEILDGMGLQKNIGYYLPKGFELLEKEEALHELVNWLNKNSGELKKQGVEIAQESYKKKFFTGKQELKLGLQAKKDWFDVFATVSFGDYNIPFVKLKKYILSGTKEFELPDGTIAILPEEWFAQFSDIIPYSKTDGNNLKFKKHHFSILKNNLKGIPHEVVQKLNGLSLREGIKIKPPEGLKARLRGYQEIGYKWLFHLNRNGFGGCLADDMGLGKTLQTLTLLLKTKKDGNQEQVLPMGLFETQKDDEPSQPASLIVVPTSLVHNWENEIEKFAPSLKIYSHVGVKRKKNVSLETVCQHYDVILTTYGTVRNDAALMSGLTFYYLILDESQYIKNPNSKTYKTILGLKSQYRLTLTGTPIENSLTDLWAQVNFLNKGLLGNLAYFRRAFITPIEKHNNQEKKEKLQVLIRPFVLRRTKTEVAKELPPLMEQVRYCPMEEGQSSIYEHEKSVIRNTILDNIEKEGVDKSSFILLQGLTRLRQLANHPQLLDKENVLESGKYNEIFRSLNNIIAEGHKVLIFSAFVQHLDLIENGLNKNKWGYCKLTGQTTNRKEVIAGFQDDPAKQVFLISLKAGGVGLNLTQADYVFIIDPWWNPAAENQAISRAHRIGQDKHVFVYRFITESSIEEKILQLQQQKSKLADTFINSNNPFKEISKDEILNLLK